MAESQGHTIEAELLETSKEGLKVRRQSGLRILHVPVQILSPEDQTFAAYLWKKKNPAPTKRTNEQMILDEIFGGF